MARDWLQGLKILLETGWELPITEKVSQSDRNTGKIVNWMQYENEYKTKGFKCICGVDEAGRGPLAGPVFAAAVIMNDKFIEGINDSKKISAKKREFLYDIIVENAQSFSISFVNEKTIDEINILNATFLAMQNAVNNLKIAPDFVLVDGNRSPKLAVCSETIVKGDSLCTSIACASILAKVSRDRYMLELAQKYPQYEFDKHKGYGTKLHIEKIREHGISPVHRKSFLSKILKKS